MRWKPWLSAAGICFSVTLALWIARTGGRPAYAVDLLGSELITMTTVWVGWLVGGRLTPDPDRRALISLFAGMWGLLFNTVQIIAVVSHLGSAFESPLFAGVTWTAICCLIIWVASQGTAPLTFLPRVLAFGMIFLLASQCFRMWGVFFTERHSTVAIERRNGKTPDVFVILLDKYSSDAWLSHTYGVDERPFEDSLRALGFTIPVAARANYAHTGIALASFLNWRYIAAPLSGETGHSWDEMRLLISDARVWKTFHDKGYRVVAFPTTFPLTRSFEGADAELRTPTFTSSPFGATWLLNSPLASAAFNACPGPLCLGTGPMPYPIETVDDIEWKLKTLASLPDSTGPVFVFLHLLSPHEPYLFNADCSARQPWWPLSDQGKNFDLVGAAYATQIKCLDRLLLPTIRSLIRRSSIPPVILLQADHGQGRIDRNATRGFTMTANELSRDQLGERMGIFAAYKFPGADSAVYQDISPVNVIPLVLTHLFNALPQRLPDRSYYSAYQDPFSFTEVPAELTHPPKPAH
jgi:hypothetical protein